MGYINDEDVVGEVRLEEDKKGVYLIRIQLLGRGFGQVIKEMQF